ncbi:MAG: 50S ribosomal protein L4 [Eubacterium sp.]|nr:50S ribosomal protein L4 [Eubacterium sp.]
MAKVSVYNTDGKEVETIDLSDNIFGVEINETLVHKAVVAHLANRRQGTQSALTRSEVRGGGKKPWRQKGTGHARQGSIRAPQWTGGGVVFAPKPRDYAQKMNKREKQIALFSVLTSKVQDEKLIVVDNLDMDTPKTAAFVKVLGNLKADKALVVTSEKNDNLVLSARNIPDVKTVPTNSINVYDILNHDALVITKDAVKAIEEVYA